MAAFLAQAAVRRTPVILDGVMVGAAAMLAEELAPGAREWWVAGHRSVEPAHELVLEHLELVPVLDLQLRLGEGSGAVTALPIVQMAARVLAEMATFGDAGVSGPAGETALTP
jgi:nicotinate-nucleotide--dimethylbenzimidazole phosphoribosyltransferase